MGLLSELRRRWWLVAVVAIGAVLLASTSVAGFVTEVMWFESVGYVEVFWTLLGTRVGVGVAAGVGIAVLLGANLLLARRLAPEHRVPTPQEAVIERYRQAFEPLTRPLLLTVSVVVGVMAGLAAVSEWRTVLLWLNGVEFGRTDPQFGNDLAYFVFRLPFWEALYGWLFTALIIVTLLTALAHYVFGGLRPQVPGRRLTPQANAHLSILLGAIVAVRAWGYVLDQHLLSYSERGVVTGLSYTDVNAQLIAYQLLAIVAVVVALLFFANARLRSFLLPASGLAILLIAAVVLSGIYPAVIQRVQVEPQEEPREREFIERNLELTRFGFGLDEVETEPFAARADLDQEAVRDNATTLSQIRLWDPATLQSTYQQLQEFRPYYDFRDVDVDRYTIDDELTQVMLSVREISERDLPEASQTWQNRRLFFTHGYGLVSSDTSTAGRDGQPVFLARDIPVQGVDTLDVDNPRIYFGENPPDYSVVGTEQPEFDFPRQEGPPETYAYTGSDGVQVGTPLRRLLFALRMAEPNLVLSNLINDDSRILLHRDIRERIELVAPFLELDHDPYPVAVDGRIKWIQDAYTTSDRLPYSERVDMGQLTVAEQRVFVPETTPDGEVTLREEVQALPGAEGVANYIRNSVKAVIDAYSGEVTLYVVEPDDPIIQTWQEIFPDAFVDVEEASDDLRAHFRYPEDMFRVQSALYRTYHIDDPSEFYTKEDAWEIPSDAAFAANQQSLAQDGQATAGGGGSRPMRPHYLVMRLPGEDEEEFALIQPFTPAERENLIGWLAGRSDPEHYGQLRAYEMPPDRTVFGPGQAQARIDQDDQVAQQITLWNQSGSRVIYGNLLVIPVEDSLLYAQPLFLRAQESEIPELRKVVLVFGDEVVMEDTLAEALTALFGEAAPGVRLPRDIDPEELEEVPEEALDPDEDLDPELVDPDAVMDPRVAALLDDALERFAEAEQALTDGDLGAYRELTREAEDLLREAQGLMRDGAGTAADGGDGEDGTDAAGGS